MTADRSIEAHVADSARAWREASRNQDAAVREVAERKLADFLERWIAELLATDEAWPHQGRWFDGIVFHECRAEEDERFVMSGSIWSIDQKQWPFRASLQLSTGGMAAFDVHFGDRKPSNGFRFTRGG